MFPAMKTDFVCDFIYDYLGIRKQISKKAGIESCRDGSGPVILPKLLKS